MFLRHFALGMGLLAVAFHLLPGRADAQERGDDRVYRSLTTEQLENILTGHNVQFKKTEDQKQRGTIYYDFKRGNYNVRLTYFDGKDLMIDNIFNRPIPLDKINDWNKKAKFSRASWHKDNLGEFVMLEYNLDILGGVTRGNIRQFINQFDAECGNFDRFLGTVAAKPNPPAVGAAEGEKVHAPVSNAVLEHVLKDLNVQFQKKDAPDGATIFDFKMNGFGLRLYNYSGKDLMVDATFRKTDLATVNKYNVDRKFVRAVAYNTGGNEYTALESNLDCVAGVTEGMIRHLIVEFVRDVQHFSDYLNKLP
jgi:hypothetical protein